MTNALADEAPLFLAAKRTRSCPQRTCAPSSTHSTNGSKPTGSAQVSLTLTLTHSHPPSLTHCHSLTRTHSHSLTLTHPHSLPLTLIHSLSLNLTDCPSPSLSLTLTHSHSHSLTLTHSLSGIGPGSHSKRLYLESTPVSPRMLSKMSILKCQFSLQRKLTSAFNLSSSPFN